MTNKIEDYVKLAEEATEGPWSVTRYTNYEGWSIHTDNAGCIAERWYDKSCPYPDDELSANVQFIAASRTLGPAMAKALIEAEECIKALHAAYAADIEKAIEIMAELGRACDPADSMIRQTEKTTGYTQALATIQRIKENG